MKPQTLYRVDVNKKVKPTKMEKAYNALQKRQRQAASAALALKKETAV